eukprot:UN17544
MSDLTNIALTTDSHVTQLVQFLTSNFEDSTDFANFKRNLAIMDTNEDHANTMKSSIREVVAHFSFQYLLERALIAPSLSERRVVYLLF